ncbi:hypothetical protein [Chryseobacterium tongliaoense]|uniref:hypothetical protein n=1 Tax=Chryseobacterium tongliaoense TaxID=3240933 RepID=UPI003515FF63
MKHKIATSDKVTDHLTDDQICDDTACYPAEKIDLLNFYRFSYSYPFMPMIDLTIAFDELRKMVKGWLKKENIQTNKKRIYENL